MKNTWPFIRKNTGCIYWLTPALISLFYAGTSCGQNGFPEISATHTKTSGIHYPADSIIDAPVFISSANRMANRPKKPSAHSFFNEAFGNIPNAFQTINDTNTSGTYSRFNGAGMSVAPVNNICENAQLIQQSTDFNCNNAVSGTTLSATTDPDDVTICQPLSCCPDVTLSITNEVWYKFTPTHSNFVIAVYNLQGIGGSEPTQAVLSVFEGTCGGGLQTLSCGGTAPAAFFTPTPGSTYYLSVSIVDDNGTAVPANFDLCLFRETSFQSNPECHNSTGMAVSPTISCTNKKSGFTSLAEDYSLAWYEFTPSASGYVTIKVDNFVGRYGNIMPSPDYAALTVYSTQPCGPLCNTCDFLENFALAVEAPLNMYVTAGVQYRIAVIIGNSRSGSTPIPSTFDICVRPITPPVNDECAGAIPVNASTTASCENKVQASTQFANNSTQSGQRGDVWFSYTSGSSERITISADNFGAVSNLLHIPRKAAYIDLYTGSCGNLTPVASGYAPLSVDVAAGTYYAKVRTLADASTDLPATFDFCIRTCAPPPNDVIANTSPAMHVITESPDFNCTITTTGTTECAIKTLSSGFTEVWYSFTPSSTGFYGFEATSSSSQNCALVLFEVSSNNNLVPIGYAFGPAGTNLTAGTEYKLAVGTFDGDLGVPTQEDFSICVYYDPAFSDTDNDGIFDPVDNCVGSPTVGLNFDGVDDYIEVPDADELSLTGDFTLEVWVKVTDFDNFRDIVGKVASQNGRPSPFDYYLLKDSGRPRILVGNDSNFQFVDATNAPTPGQWAHLAVVKNGTSITHYLNGLPNGTGTVTFPAVDNASSMIIGSRAGFPIPMKGNMDELRIWNTPRTQQQIQENIQTELTGMETGLVAYYPFNEGTPNGDNIALVSVIDKSGNGNSGSLRNFHTKGLEFDGINDYLEIPTVPANEFASINNFTVEFSVRIPGTSQPSAEGFGVVLLERLNSSVIGYPFSIGYRVTDNKIGAARFDGSNNPSISSATTFNDDQWHHIAFVKEGSTLRLYVDGQQEGTAFDNTSNIASSTFPIVVGRRPEQSGRFYLKGSMEELRFWNVARTPAQINATMNQQLTGTESGLVGYYPFDDNINSAVAPIDDNSTIANNGTAYNFELTDNTLSNWTFGAPVNELDSDNDGSGDSCDLCQGNDTTGDHDMDGICNNLDPDAPAACNEDIAAVQPVQYASGPGTTTVRASQTITTNGIVIVPQGAAVIYTAGQAITLTPGFQAQANSTFSAKIESCTSSSATELETRSEEIEEIQETRPEALTLKVFPNPTSGMTNIQYDLPEESGVTLQVYNLQGRVVQTLLQSGLQPSGKHFLEWNASDLAGGLYLVSIKTASDFKIQKLMVAKSW